MTNAEARFNIALRPRRPESSLGRTAQDGHLDSHTAPELWVVNKRSFEPFMCLDLALEIVTDGKNDKTEKNY